MLLEIDLKRTKGGLNNMSWEELLKVQVVNTKQGIKTSQRKLPEPDDSNCKETLRKWLKKANELIAKYELNFFPNENVDNLDRVSDEIACRVIKIYNDAISESPPAKSRHFGIDNEFNVFVSTPGIYYFNSVPYYMVRLTLVKNWVNIYTCQVSMNEEDWQSSEKTHSGMETFGREYLDFTK